MSFEASRQYNAEAESLIAGAVNSNVRLSGATVPLCFERAEGAYLFDIDGNRMLDYALGMGPAILGHAPKPVIDAVTAALGQGQMYGGQHRAELALARLIQAAVPNAEMLRVGMSGSEMVQAALRLSRAATGRSKFIKFEGQYHGWFDNVLISNAPPVPDVDSPNEHVRQPHLETRGQVKSAAEDVIVLPWNDLTAVKAVLEAPGSDVAALLTEPMMCNTGVIPPKPGFLEGLRELTAKHGVILIFDEVITGFRVALGGAQSRFGVTPDLATFAKAMAGGFPIAALTGRRDLMEMFGTGAVNHSGTYNTNVPSVVAAVATLEVLSADDGAALKRVEATGDRLIEGLRRLAHDAGVPLRVSGVGAAFNTYFADAAHDLVDYRSYRRTDLTLQKNFIQRLALAGIRPTGRGTWFVSAAHGAAEVEATLAAAKTALQGSAA
ncbi:MAG: aspartate aminotransferase family protein [Hyphomicrobiales bacterium]|nr:MAG: aspartate aminotransferase family protein [Hyphomicrobiales bacterium]